MYNKLASDWTVLVVVVSDCSPNPVPRDDDIVRFAPEDTIACGAEDNGIEKLIIGCLICELLVLAVD